MRRLHLNAPGEVQAHIEALGYQRNGRCDEDGAGDEESDESVLHEGKGLGLFGMHLLCAWFIPPHRDLADGTPGPTPCFQRLANVPALAVETEKRHSKNLCDRIWTKGEPVATYRLRRKSVREGAYPSMRPIARSERRAGTQEHAGSR